MMKRFLSVLTLAVYSSQLLVSCGLMVDDGTGVERQGGEDARHTKSLTGDAELSPPMDSLVPTELDNEGFVPGTLEGRFNVTSDGAATYQVPLWVPAGRASIQPALSLNYNSRGGNGLLGMGFALSGLSQIVRCNKTVVQDGATAPVNFDSADALCLDGARLIETGSLGGGDKTYTTEVERFSHIIARQADAYGPAWFEVQLKSGIILEYGREGSSRIEGYRMHYMPDPNSPSTSSLVVGDHASQWVRYGWSLSRMRDRNGNYLAVDYELRTSGSSGSGYGYEQLPVAIRYTGSTTDASIVTPRRSVRFFYQPVERPDRNERFVSGFRLVSTRLLDNIVMKEDAAWGMLRRYRFVYGNDSVSGRSRLNRLLEDDASGYSKRPLIFTWELGAPGTGRDPMPSNGDQYFLRVPVPYMAPSVVENPGVPDDAGYPSAADFWTLQALDINGDGRDDLMYRFSPSASGKIQKPKWYMRLNLDGRSFGPPTLLNTLPEAKTGDGLDDLRAVDFNNDGKVDLAALFVTDANTGVNGRYQFFHSTGSGFTETQADFVDFWFDQTQPARLPTLHLADLNGDGLPDMARSISGGGIYPYEWAVRMTQVVNGTPSYPQNNQPTGVGAGLDHAGYVADVDGDGSAELLVREPQFGTSDNYSRFLVALGRTASGAMGKKLTTTLSTLPVPNSYNPYIYRHHWFMDINGDGLPDSVSAKVQKQGQESGNLEIAINTGNGFAPPVTQPLPAGAQVSFSRLQTQHRFTDVGVRVLDFNLDGKQDLLLMDGGYGVGIRTHLVVLQSTGSGFEVRDLNIPIGTTTGLGNLLQVSTTGQGSSYKGSGWGMKMSQVLDANGDGLTDIVQVEGQTVNGQVRYSPVLYLRNSYKPDLLKSVEDGLGNRITVNYEATTYKSPTLTATHHTPGTCVYPRNCDVRAQWLVASHSEPDGKYGSTRTLTYEYNAGRMDLQGRGWLGFASRTVTDAKAATRRTTTFDNQTRTGRFYLGAHQPAEEVLTVTLDNGQVDTLKTTSQYGYQSKLNGAVVFPFLWKTISSNVDGQDGEIRRAVSTNQYDPYGNLTHREVTSKQGYSFVTDTTYDNFADPGDYLLGLPRRVSTTSQTPSGLSQTRTKELRYCEGTSCRPTSPLLLKEIVEPDAVAPERESVWLQTVYTRNAAGLPTQVVSTDDAGRSRRIELKYDAYERMLVTARLAYPTNDPAGPVLRTDYAYHRGLGLMTLTESPNGQRTRWYHDGLGRIRAEDGPTASDVIVSYGSEPASLTVSTTEVDLTGCTSSGGVLDFASCVRNGQETKSVYDTLGREDLRKTRGFDGNWVQVATTYDTLGRVESVSLPATPAEPRVVRRFEYDKRDRLRFVRNPDGTFSETKYSGVSTYQWDEKRNQSLWSENDLGLLWDTGELTPQGYLTTAYQYGPFGLPRIVTDNSNNQTMLEYDRLGRRTLINDPDSGITRTKYSAFGDVREQTDANGNTVQYTHDGVGRALTVTNQPTATGSLPEVTTLTWDTAAHGLGLLHTATSPDGVMQTHEYDPLSRPSQTHWNIQGQDYWMGSTYDALGRVETVAYPEVPGRSRLGVRYNYTSQGDVKSVQNVLSGFTYWTATARNSTGLLTGERFGNGVSSVRRYDPLGKLRFIDTTGAAGAVQSLSYDYEANGNLHSRIDRLAQVTEDFQYDRVDRLTRWTVYKGCNNATFTYGYDGLGNLTSRTSKLGSTSNAPFESITYLYGDGSAGPHAVTSAGLDNFEYDNNGNLKRHQDATGRNRLLEYNYFNLPKRITEGTAQWTFGYDASHNRVFKQGNDGTSTVYVGGVYEKRKASDGTLAHHFTIQAPEGAVAQVTWSDTPVLGGEVVAYLHMDRLGSIESVTGTGGTVLEHRKYDPFGLRKNAANPALPLGGAVSSSVRQGFTGHEHDEELGLINMKGRLYDPKLSRFLSPDPFVAAPLFTQSYNRYSYALNNPLRFTDPTGFFTEEPETPEQLKAPHINFDVDEGEEIIGRRPNESLFIAPKVLDALSSTPSKSVSQNDSKGTGIKSSVGSADQNGSRATAVEAVAYGALGFVSSAGAGVAISYGIGAIAGVLGAPVAIAIGVGLAGYGLYQLANGGAEALKQSGQRLIRNEGTADDYYALGSIAGGIVSGAASRMSMQTGAAHGARALSWTKANLAIGIAPQVAANGTIIRTSAEGVRYRFNTEHSYGRPHVNLQTNVAKSFAETGLTAIEVENAIMHKLESFRAEGGTLPTPAAGGLGGAKPFNGVVTVGEHSVGFRAVMLETGVVSVGTYFPL
jgi:RHS repeat-associated protein